MTNKDSQHLYDHIVDNGNYKLTKWETDFLDSIALILDEGRNLSVKQGDVLQKIHRKSHGG